MVDFTVVLLIHIYIPQSSAFFIIFWITVYVDAVFWIISRWKKGVVLACVHACSADIFSYRQPTGLLKTAPLLLEMSRHTQIKTNRQADISYHLIAPHTLWHVRTENYCKGQVHVKHPQVSRRIASVCVGASVHACMRVCMIADLCHINKAWFDLTWFGMHAVHLMFLSPSVIPANTMRWEPLWYLGWIRVILKTISQALIYIWGILSWSWVFRPVESCWFSWKCGC